MAKEFKEYRLGEAYSSTDGYWWEIQYSDPKVPGGTGKYYVTQNGVTDKVCSTYEKACKWMQKQLEEQ